MTAKGAEWWRGFWEQALTGGETVVHVRVFDAELRSMLAEFAACEADRDRLRERVRALRRGHT